MSTTDTTRKAIAYYRVSTARQGESGLGLEAQQNAVEQFATASQMEILDAFVEVESGKKKDRPQLAAALATAKKAGAVLVIAKLDRLARNVAVVANLMESGVDFVAVDNPTANRLTIHILAAVAEDEALRISERTKAALAAAKARGVKLGTTGKAHGKLQGPKLAKANREAAADRAALIADTVAEIQNAGSSTLRGIADELNRRSVPTAQGKEWHPTSVSRLLKRLEASESLLRAA